jgi:minor extracellular serine protease Vpr
MGMSFRVVGLAVLFAASAFSQTYSTHYALILDDSPVAERFVTRDAMRTTQADGYRRQILNMQDAVRREAVSRRLQVAGSVETVLNAVFVVASPAQLGDMQSIPGVKAVIPMRQGKADMNRATQLINAPAAWAAVGGQTNGGAGIKVAIFDSGIDQTHPAFNDAGYTAPAGFPKCTDGHPEDCAYTNKKVIVARSYVRQIANADGKSAASSRPDDFSPRDHDGHGTGVASVVAGNVNTGAVTFSGVAPKAFLGSYKIYGSPWVNDYFTEDVLIKAVEDAVKDGMDVGNFSSHLVAVTGPFDTGAACGRAADMPCDPAAVAFDNAVKAGMVMVASAGNNGADGSNIPTFNSIGSPANVPSVIAVGATTNSHYFTEAVSVSGGPANLRAIVANAGDDPYQPYWAESAPLIDSAALGDQYACSALPAGSLAHSFVLVQRGPLPSTSSCPFSDKVGNATDAGAVGVVIYNYNSSTLPFPGNLAGYGVPIAMISNADGLALKSYLGSHAGAVVIIDPSGIEQDDSANSNLLTYYSSVGPTLGDAALKPDLVAPGSSIYMAAQTYDRLGLEFSASGYMANDGTSFSAPLVAGAAALVKQKHPTWTPAQMRSALINTASQDITTDDSGSAIDTEWIGAGKLDAGAAVNAAILANPTSVSFGVVAAAASPAKTITLTNTGSASVTLAVAVVVDKKSSTSNSPSGTAPVVDKTILTLAAGATGTVTLTLNGALPVAGSYSGAVTLQASGVSLRVPYLYFVAGPAYDIVPLDGIIDGMVGQPIYNTFYPRRPSAVAVKVVDANGVPVANAPISWSASPRNSVTFQSPDATTNAYGIAAAGIVPNQTGSFTVTAQSGTLSTSTANCRFVSPVCFDGSARSQPAIKDGGVVDSAAFQSPIAPGSYAAIFGSALSDYTDSASTTILPLAIDGVTISFDVSSAGISVPARLTYVGAGQVNVQVPWELQGQTSAQVKVTIYGFLFGNVVTVPLADVSPAFFESSGLVVAQDAVTGALLYDKNPAKAGEFVTFYANGLGPVNNQPASGDPAPGGPNLATTKNTATLTIGGKSVQVLFSGLAPGFPGLYQVNAAVPAGLTAGNQDVVLSMGGKTAKTTKLPVQ